MKITRTLMLSCAAGVALTGGAVAGAASGGDDQPGAGGVKAPESIAARQSAGLAEYATTKGGELVDVGTVTTKLAKITLSRVVRGTDVLSVCISAEKLAGGGSQACRSGSDLTKPLVSVSRDATGAVVVTGVAPGTSGDARAVNGAGKTITGTTTATTARTGADLGYQPVAVRVEGEGDLGLSYTDPATGRREVETLAGTIRALDEK